MKETKLKAFAKLHTIIEPYDAGIVIYRGAKSVDFPLIPKIGRIVPPDLAKADEMDKILIPNSIRLTLKKTLHKYGVDRFSLFPGPDSLAAQIEWLEPMATEAYNRLFLFVMKDSLILAGVVG